ncbi:MAG: hypothetical protein OER80_10255 [Gammaproteobacteria bacterium]|nr:hypothetical protein [Gammaproteobacteria bacterium]MDH3767911.1 hypothetical protein [Gammaproteobacteria bacterium]
MLVIEDPDAIDSTHEAITRVGARFSIAHDALLNNRSHLDDALEHYLDVLFTSLADFQLGGPDKEPLDDRVVGALYKMKGLRDQFLDCVDVALNNERSSEIHNVIRQFLGRSLVYKHAPRDIIHFNHLWCDHYRFLLRELFLGVIALLIKNQEYEEVNTYLDAHYLFETDRGPQTTSFLGFDAYIKTLDEFRTRRLHEQRISAAADFQRERADLNFLSFDDIMQADFLLCIRGLLHYPKALTRWFPRTLVYAEKFEKSGFDLFFSARSKGKFPPVRTLLGVKNRAELTERFAKVVAECSLTQWKFGGVPIPFERYLGLTEPVNA